MASFQEEPSFSTGVHIDSKAIIQQLRDTLERYNPQDIIREIIQNADDAGAHQIFFFLLEKGLSSEIHPLLQHPALLVFNDGPLKESDVAGITLLIGGSKQEDTTKIGRFGLGLKSLFHICEAFFFAPYRPSHPDIKGQLFDPWIGIRNTDEFENYLPRWENKQVGRALEVIHQSLEEFFEDRFDNSFFIYVPLRDEFFDSNFINMKKEYFTSSSFEKNILHNSINGIVLSLSQCTLIENIEIYSALSLSSLKKSKNIYKASIKRKNILRRPDKQEESFK